MDIFSKRVFLDNLDYFMAQKSIKPRELEEAARVSKGYISRLKNANNQSVPGVDFLLAASSMFGISVEALSTINFVVATENEIYYIKFLDSLITKTTRHEVIWKSCSFKDFKNKIENKTEEELIIEREPSPIEMIPSILNGKRKYNSSFKYGHYAYDETEGDFYSLNIDQENTLYIVKVHLTRGEEVFYGIEMFMILNHSRKSNVCCISPEHPQKYDTLLRKLYETVRQSVNVNLMDDETKRVIDSFMQY